MGAYTFAVVTGTGPYPGNHTMIDPGTYVLPPNELPHRLSDIFDDPFNRRVWSELRSPVFEVGEILILGPDGREPGTSGRKPSKWDVTIAEFTTVEQAVSYAAADQRLKGSTQERGIDQADRSTLWIDYE